MKKKIFFLTSVLFIFLLSTFFFTNFNHSLSKISIFEKKYTNIEKSLVNNCDYSNQINDLIQKNIISKLNSKKAFLDIGAGPGKITQLLSKKFIKTYIVEPNENYNDFYKENNFITYNLNYMDYNLDKKYDFILCSHVLYYVGDKDWTAFIKKIYDSLEKGGKAVIVLIAPKGIRHQLQSSINPNIPIAQKLKML